MPATQPSPAQPSEPPKARVGIAIINFRTADLTIGCLESLIGELEAVDGRAAIVDNRSGDSSPDEIDAWIAASPIADRCQLVRSPVNTGFSGGCNLGVAAVNADYYVMLNSDARLRKGALPELIAAAERHPEAGAVAPRLEFDDGTPQQNCFRFHSPASEMIGSALSSPITRLLKAYQVSLPISDTPYECDWASFACILIRGDAYRAVGPMDEGYFMYYEDADYCHALKQAGWKIMHDPAPRVVHLRGGSSPVKTAHSKKTRPPAYYYASRTRYFRKLYGPLGPTAANLLWLFGRIFARLRPLTGKPFRPACEKQSSDIWTNWRAPLGDRRAPSVS